MRVNRSRKGKTQGVDYFVGAENPNFIEFQQIWTGILRAMDLWLQEPGKIGQEWTAGEVYWNLVRVSNQNGFEIEVPTVQALSARLRSLYGTKIGMKMGMELTFIYSTERGNMQAWFQWHNPFGREPTFEDLEVLFRGVRDETPEFTSIKRR